MCRVVWVTNSSAQVPTVVYGTSPDALTLTALGNTSTYTAADMCGPSANQSVYVVTSCRAGVLMIGTQDIQLLHCSWPDPHCGDDGTAAPDHLLLPGLCADVLLWCLTCIVAVWQ